MARSSPALLVLQLLSHRCDAKEHGSGVSGPRSYCQFGLVVCYQPLDETKYEESDIVMNDGINYIFLTAEYGKDIRIGQVRSPKDKTKMGQLVNIVELYCLLIPYKI